MSILDWALLNDLNSQPDHVKVEFCLLSNKLGLEHDTIKNLTFSDNTYKAYAHYLFPLLYPMPVGDFVEHYETNFIKTILGISSHSYAPFSTTNILVGLHDVFFETNFGAAKQTNVAYAEYIKTNTETNFWLDKNNDETYFTYVDFLSECGIALKCLNDDISEEEILLINTLDMSYANWQNYHTFITKELYEVL